MARPEDYYRAPQQDELARYVNNNITPPVDHMRLDMSLVTGEDRSHLYTPTTGDMSLVLLYKGREGYLASMGDGGEELSVLQFQGAKRGEGYRVSRGVHLVRLFASQIHTIAAHPESPYREISMPEIFMIEGAEDANWEKARSRYEDLAVELGLKYSHDEKRYVKKTK